MGKCAVCAVRRGLLLPRFAGRTKQSPTSAIAASLPSTFSLAVGDCCQAVLWPETWSLGASLMGLFHCHVVTLATSNAALSMVYRDLAHSPRLPPQFLLAAAAKTGASCGAWKR